MGSNSLAAFFVCVLTCGITYSALRLFMNPLLRVSKVQEIIGQDVYFMFAIFDRVIKNHLYGIINAYYPEPAGEYALKKHKLMTDGGLVTNVAKAKKDNRKAQFQLTMGQLLEMKQICEHAIKKRKVDDESSTLMTREGSGVAPA